MSTTLERWRAGTLPYMELHDLPLGMRFKFFAFPEQTATLVAVSRARATVKYDHPQDAVRTFEAEELVKTANGTEKRRKCVTIRKQVGDAPCALGAQVVPLEGEAT